MHAFNHAPRHLPDGAAQGGPGGRRDRAPPRSSARGPRPSFTPARYGGALSRGRDGFAMLRRYTPPPPKRGAASRSGSVHPRTRGPDAPARATALLSSLSQGDVGRSSTIALSSRFTAAKPRQGP